MQYSYFTSLKMATWLAETCSRLLCVGL